MAGGGRDGEKEPTYDEAQIAERLQRAARLVLRGRLDPPRLQDRRLADDADARERDRLLSPRRRITIPISSVTWGRVTVKLSTHSAGGITDKDFALARQIEDVVLWRPAAGGALDGHAEQVRAERRPALMTAAVAGRRSARRAGGARRAASSSSPAGSPSRRCGACSPRWRRRSRTTSPSSRSPSRR